MLIVVPIFHNLPIIIQNVLAYHLIWNNGKLPCQWSIKDTMAHLRIWQQRSLARLEAALQNRQPQFPGWPETLDPDSDDDLDQVNAWIFETNRDRAWESVYKDWRAGYLRLDDHHHAVIGPVIDRLGIGQGLDDAAKRSRFAQHAAPQAHAA